MNRYKMSDCLTKIQLSPIVWGAWRLAQAQLSVQTLNRLINSCVELGITSFDHADIYGGYTAEVLFGEALALSPGLRRQIQLLTKGGIAAVSSARPTHRIKIFNSSASYIEACVDRSLAALQVQQLDVFMIHRPDFLMDAVETAQVLQKVVLAGKVRAVGVSNFKQSQVALLRELLQIPIAVNQVECSLARLDPWHNGLLDQCQQWGITPMAWSPLAGGAVFGESELAQRLAPELARIADQYGCAVDAVALAWLMRSPSGIVPVVGSLRIERLQRAWRATQLQLSRDDWYSLYVAATGCKLP